MKFYILLILLSFIESGFSANLIEDDLRHYSRINPDEAFLADLPLPTNEYLRFNLPADFWKNHNKYLTKGALVEIVKTDSEDGMVVEKEVRLDFFSILNEPTRIDFSFSQDQILQNENVLCSFNDSIGASAYSKTYLRCGSFYCVEEKSAEEKIISNFKGLSSILSDIRPLSKNRNCPFPLSYFSNEDTKGKSTSVIQFDEIKNDVGIVTINQNKYYSDLKPCLKNKTCSIQNKKFSDYEIAWMNLKQVRSQKNYNPLNFLIANLKPCVERKDKKCIQKYLVSKEDVWKKDEKVFSHEIKIVDEGIIANLDECLSYDRLLPFGRRMRGFNGNICIIYGTANKGGAKYKIISITLPDAFKEDETEVLVNYGTK